MESTIEKIVENLDLDEICKYCTYGIDCPGPVTGGPNGPIFAPCHDGNPENWFDLDSYIEEEREMLEIEKIIYNNPATIVWFADGEKIVVKAHNEEFDKEKGVAMAIARKLYSRSQFVKIVEGGKDQQPWIRASTVDISRLKFTKTKKDKGEERNEADAKKE